MAISVNSMQTLVSDLSKVVGGFGNTRRAHGYWLPYAWAVKALVARGFSVSDACRHVARNTEAGGGPKELNCLRVVYYKIRDTPWPAGLYEALMGLPLPEDSVFAVREPKKPAVPPTAPAMEPESSSVEPESSVEPKYVTEDTEDSPAEPEPEDDPIPEDLRAELEAEVQSGFIPPPEPEPVGAIDPEADAGFIPAEIEEFEV